MTYTSGPWVMVEDDGDIAIETANGVPLFESTDKLPLASMRDNGTVAALAPDLIEALLNFTAGRDIAYTAALEIARAVVAKVPAGAPATLRVPYYSRPLTPPANRKEGLLNFVQMIINRIEAGDTREALLTAVDLLDTLSGKANPFEHLTDSVSRPAFDAELKAQADAARLERLEYGARCRREGEEAAKAVILKHLTGKLDIA